MRIVKINYHPRLLDNKLGVYDINHENGSISGPDPMITNIISPGEIFEPAQLSFPEIYQILAIYSKTKKTFYDINFLGKKVNRIRRYRIGINVEMFRYGTNSNVGLFLYNHAGNVESIKLENDLQQ